MKTINLITITIITFILMCPASWATTYYIDGTTGNDSNSGSSSKPWKTILKANSTLKAGDTVFVKKGTYKQTIRPNNSGTNGNYITYARYGSDKVIITGVDGTSLNKDSDGKNITTGVDGAILSNRSYIIIDGFNFLNVDYFVYMNPNGHHNIVQNCYMAEGTHYGGLVLIDGANYNKILNNTLIGKCEPHDLLQIRTSNHNLIDGNKLYYGVHDGIIMLDLTDGTTSYNIIRNNYIQNKWHSNVDIYGVELLLFENNIVVDGGENYTENPCGSDRDRAMARVDHKGIMTNTKYSIIRNNILINNGYGIGLASSSGDAYKGLCKHNRYYNNTINKNIVGIRSSNSNEKRDLILKNNIVYNNTSSEISVGGTNNTIYYINNNIGGSGTKYGVSSSNVIDGLSLNPLFIDEENRDLGLQQNSPMIDAGTFLTTATNSGNGQTIQVEDARYFMDGWGIIEGDLIQLEGQTQTARISNVNYSTNTITVSTSLNWTKGQGIALAYQGSAPDIGALEYGADSSPAEPVDPSPPESIKHCCLYLEAEDMDLISPMVKGIDANASGGGFIEVPSGENSTSPNPEATYQFTLPASGTYYLWISIYGADFDSNALYVGIDGTWDRVFASTLGVYQWLKVEISDKSKNYGFNLSAGNHTLRIGHGEINAKADALYLSNESNKEPAKLVSPSFKQ